MAGDTRRGHDLSAGLRDHDHSCAGHMERPRRRNMSQIQIPEALVRIVKIYRTALFAALPAAPLLAACSVTIAYGTQPSTASSWGTIRLGTLIAIGLWLIMALFYALFG